VVLPEDFTYHLPKFCLEWLRSYSITNKEIVQHKFGWSQEKELLILPVYDGFKQLVFWQGRGFKKGKGKTHFASMGSSSRMLHIIGELNNDFVVVVEDIVSAIKVARYLPAMPLFGSSMSDKMIEDLSIFKSHMLLWLDFDKAKYSIKTCIKASLFLDKAIPIITNQDPKAYRDDEIKDILDEKLAMCPRTEMFNEDEL
jgi:hypothetical protein